VIAEPLSLAVADTTGELVVRARGEVDIYTAPRLRECLVALLAAGRREIVVDLSGVSLLDGRGLAGLLEVLRLYREHGGDIVLRMPRPATQKLLDLTGLDRVFTIET
jgi:anti-sigma B factor antagonist